jgi:hypothetical protein
MSDLAGKAANLDRPRAHIELLRKRRGVTEIGDAKDPAVIIIDCAKRERWERLAKGFYELVEASGP